MIKSPYNIKNNEAYTLKDLRKFLKSEEKYFLAQAKIKKENKNNERLRDTFYHSYTITKQLIYCLDTTKEMKAALKK